MQAICTDFRGSGGIFQGFWAKMLKIDLGAQKYYLRLVVDSKKSSLLRLHYIYTSQDDKITSDALSRCQKNQSIPVPYDLGVY